MRQRFWTPKGLVIREWSASQVFESKWSIEYIICHNIYFQDIYHGEMIHPRTLQFKIWISTRQWRGKSANSYAGNLSSQCKLAFKRYNELNNASCNLYKMFDVLYASRVNLSSTSLIPALFNFYTLYSCNWKIEAWKIAIYNRKPLNSEQSVSFHQQCNIPKKCLVTLGPFFQHMWTFCSLSVISCTACTSRQT